MHGVFFPSICFLFSRRDLMYVLLIGSGTHLRNRIQTRGRFTYVLDLVGGNC